MIPSTTIQLPLRGLTFNVRRWGDPEKPPLMMIHGSRDSSQTFQFLVDNLSDRHCFYAPDMRGHGLTDRVDVLWYHEMAADLNLIWLELFGDKPMPVIGHSMGASIGAMFASLRPERVTKFVTLDGLGPRPSIVGLNAHEAYLRHFDITEGTNRGPEKFYPSPQKMADRLRQTTPRLTPERALWLAENTAIKVAEGKYDWPFDRYLFGAMSLQRSVEEWGEIWSAVACPTLILASTDPEHLATLGDELKRRAGYFRDAEIHQIPDTHHNLHQEEPEKVAALIDDFLAR